MATPKSPKPPKKASSSSATGVTPKKQNNTGKVVDKSTPAPQKKPVTRPDVKNTHEYLDSVEPKDIPDEMGKLTKDLDKALADKDYSRATQLKDAKAGLQDKAAQAGLKVKDFAPGTLGPSLPQVEAMGAAMSAMDGDALGKKMFSKAFANIKANAKPGTKPDPKPKETAPVKPADAPPITPGGKSTSTKRTPKRKCELVPYNELDCGDGKGADKKYKHHVRPDFENRTGNRKGTTGERIPGTPSLAEGLSICLSQKEHDAVHEYDKQREALAKKAGAGRALGTISGKESKAISVKALTKVTKRGCTKKDLKSQLDKQTPDNAVVRGIEHPAAFNKHPDANKAVMNPGGKD